MNINEELFKRYKPEKKAGIITGLSDSELLAITPATVTRIIREAGTNFYRSRDKRLRIPNQFRTGNQWNSTFTGVELIKGKLYVSLYVQYANTDTDAGESFSAFFSRGDYRGTIRYEDRYGNPQTEYFIYDERDKARTIRSLLLTYVQLKHKNNYDKKKAEQDAG